MFDKYNSFLKQEQEEQTKPKLDDADNNLKGQLIIKCRESLQSFKQILTKLDSNLENEQFINDNFIMKEQHQKVLMAKAREFQLTEAKLVEKIDELNEQIQQFIRRDEQKTMEVLKLQEEITKLQEKTEAKSSQRNDEDCENSEEEELSQPNQGCCPNREAIEQQCLEHFQQLVLLLPQTQQVQMLLGAYSREVNDLTWRRMTKDDKLELKESKRCPDCNWVVWSDFFKHRRRCKGIRPRQQNRRSDNDDFSNRARKIVKK